MQRTLPARAAALAAVVSLALAGCGSEGRSQASAEGSSTGSSDSASATTSPTASPTASPSASTKECAQSRTGADAAPPTGSVTASIDVDGDGTPEQVTVAAGTTCGTTLRAGSGARPLEATLPSGEPPVSSIFGVRVPGRSGDLVVTRSAHPRGGFQLRVYAADGGELAELVRGADGTEPLVPFVATDVQEHPLSIGCAENALVVTEAVAHEPAGIAYAWDVRRTTYAVDGAQAKAGPTKEIADNVLPAQLEKDWPALVAHTAFAGCRAG